MKLNKLIIAFTAVVMLLSMAGCEEKGVNILEQDDDYVGEFNVPSSSKVDEGSALSVIAKINEDEFKVDSAIKTESSDESVIESYKINCYGINIELFHYTDDSAKFEEICNTGKFIVKSTSGKVLKEFDAVVNGHYVIVFSSTTDGSGNDKSADNQKVADLFKSLTLE